MRILRPGRHFTVADLSASARSSATTICNNAGVTNTLLLNNCILDVGMTGNIEFAQATMQVQNELIDSAVNVVELAVGGRLEIPETSCEDPSQLDADDSPVPDVNGAFSGTLSNPDLAKNWDARLDIKQCGPAVNGLLSLSSADGLSFKRRFEGEWRAGQLRLSFAFPYSHTLDVGQSACVGMAAQLTINANVMVGNWTSTNCESGGVISVVQE